MIPGMFGPIDIRRTPDAQYLLINGQVQGGALLHPGADIVGIRFEGPGPLAETIYPLGWVLAGVQSPTASAVVIGLGSGAGITQLLFTCPGVDVTCVEIDPAIIRTCRENFPLIPYYEDAGRLQIICSDAAEYLRSSEDHWGFGCADAYTGKSNDLDTSALSPLLDRCDQVYVNAIGTLEGKMLSDIAQCCAEHGKPVQEYFKATQPPARRDGLANWILTTKATDWTGVLAADPFGDVESPGAQRNAALWLEFLGTAAKASC